MIKRLFFGFTLIAYICLQSVTGAQTSANPDSSLYRILAEHNGTRLQLNQAVEYAFKNSTSVRIAEGAYLAARGAVRREAGYFDPALFFNFNYMDQDAPTASFFSGASVLSTQQWDYQTGLRMNTPIGTELELSLNATKLKTNSSFASLNPEYNTFGALSLRQPLLSGFTSTSREQLAKAERDLEAQKLRYDQEKTAVSSDVEQAYWDLYAAERNYAVQQLIREQADTLLREAELRAKTGLIGPSQVANAKTFMAEQELLLLDREEQLDKQSDALASLIGVRPDEGTRRFIPVDNPPKDFPVEDVDVLVQLALKNNLDLQASQQDIEAAEVQVSGAKWRVLPSVDLVGSIGGNGLAGSPQDVIFGSDTIRATRNGSFNDAISQSFKRDFPSWSVGVEINIPIGFRSNLGEKDRLEAEAYVAKQRYVQLTRALEEQVRSVWREIDHGKRRLEAATQGVDAAQEQVRIGLIEFHNGRTTAFELVRLGADLAVAQQRYSEALVRTAKAAATLKSLTSGKYSATM